ncbi:MAG: ATP synthase subunit I, partial [Thermodesulfobacteriota bacterium]
FHFGGLWFTIHRLTRVRHPEVEFVLSFFLRTGISIAAFFFLSGGQWEKVLAALAGFLAVRLVMVRRIGAIPKSFAPRTEDRVHGY